MGKPRNARLVWIVGAATFIRLFINTARRFAYPFAPVLARGMGVPLPAVTSIIAVNQMTGLLGLLFAPMGDRWGYRVMMLIGLGALTLGMIIGAVMPLYAPVMIALFLGGLGKTLFDPAMQAHIGLRIPYERRGMAIGIIEMSWAGSSLLGIPLIGLIIHRYDWHASFVLLGGLGVLGILVLGILIPKDRQTEPQHRPSRPLLSAPGQLLQSRPAMGAAGFSFFVSAANDTLFVIYGAWLENAFHLSVVALGLATTVIGVAELIGEIITAFVADRAGLFRTIIVGALLAAAAYLALPLWGHTLPYALAGLFFLFVAFECTIVTAISLYTELLPDARATMMSGHMAAASLGRMTGALIGGPVWVWGGIQAVGGVSASLTLLALVSLIWGLRHWRPRT